MKKLILSKNVLTPENVLNTDIVVIFINGVPSGVIMYSGDSCKDQRWRIFRPEKCINQFEYTSLRKCMSVIISGSIVDSIDFQVITSDDINIDKSK
jgi:hypothetical protein